MPLQMTVNGELMPRKAQSEHVVSVLDDVAHWLGFKNKWEYLETLPIERERIFERATY